MNKNLLFFIPSAIICALLFLLRYTGMTAHIAISVAGLLILVVLTLLTRKDWKLPVVEILMRTCYLVALVSGIVLMNIHTIPVLSIVHKLSAVLFATLLTFVFVHKLVAKES